MAKAPWARGWGGRKHGEKGEDIPHGIHDPPQLNYFSPPSLQCHEGRVKIRARGWHYALGCGESTPGAGKGCSGCAETASSWLATSSGGWGAAGGEQRPGSSAGCSPRDAQPSLTVHSCSPRLHPFSPAPFDSAASWSLKGTLIIFNKSLP